MVLRKIKFLMVKLKYTLEMWKKNNIYVFQFSLYQFKHVRSILNTYITLFKITMSVLAFYYMKTDVEDMKATRNQEHIV